MESKKKFNYLVAIIIFIAILVFITAYFLFREKTDFKLIEGQTIKIPNTDIKIKAVRISENCTSVPQPECKDEATLELSHIELNKKIILTGYVDKKYGEPNATTTFFGYTIHLKSLRDKLTVLSVKPVYKNIGNDGVGEISEKNNEPILLPGDFPNWHKYLNPTDGFSIQYPRIFEFADNGEAATSSDRRLNYNHWLSIIAKGTKFDDYLTILIFNNVTTKSLEIFSIQNSSSGDSAPLITAIENKAVMKSLHIGLDGETEKIYWLDLEKRRGVIFNINPAKAQNLPDFYKIVRFFEFIK